MGTFSLEDYADRSVFHISGNEVLTLAIYFCYSYSGTSYGNTTNHLVTIEIFQSVQETLRVIRADISLDTGKPSHHFNLTVHVNIYRGKDATISYILKKVM